MTRTDALVPLAGLFAVVAGIPARAAMLPSLTIFRLPDEFVSDVAIEPEQVPTIHGVRKVVLHNPATIAAVRAAVRRARPVPLGAGAHSVDTRWSLIFEGSGQTMHVACDRDCEQGVIDGKRVSFASRGLKAELKSLVP